MPTFKTSDDTALFYEDWGRGKPVVLLSSWGLDSRMWAHHMLRLNALGLRCIALDRRGHGRSEHPNAGYDYDRLADDIAELIQYLGLREITFIAHSMGAGECTRYLSRHGSSRIDNAIFVGAIAPRYLQSASYPQGKPLQTFADIVDVLADDLPSWLARSADDFYLPETTGTTPEVTRWTIDCVLDASLKALVDCFMTRVKADLRSEMRSIDVPLLVIHGDDDRSEPGHGRWVSELVPGSRYIEYAGAPHGLPHTHRVRLLDDMTTFIQATSASPVDAH